MLKKIVNKIDLEKIIFILVIIIMSLIMLFFISKKVGFHCDEAFSYGSSNSKFENMFSTYAKHDAINTAIMQNILSDNIFQTIKNSVYYLGHQDELDKKISEIYDSRKPIWRTSEEAKDYMTVTNGERFNYLSVYYNQAKDVHPPLFYMLVNTVSSIFANTFSKYIIFSISLIFFILSCIVIKKIFIVLNKKYLAIPSIIIYGFSMGAISTVMFQRMYMMLTFFVLYYLYLHIVLLNNNYEMNKKLKLKISVTLLLGFLTQYYFCIFALFISLIVMIYIIKSKKYLLLKKYIILLGITTIICLAIFPFAISHIFFSYRGVSSFNNTGYINRIHEYLNLIFYSFNINTTIFKIVVVLSVLTVLILSFIKVKTKDIMLLLIIPTLFYIFVIAKIAPYTELRYIMCALPILTISLVLGIDKIIQNRKIVLAVILIPTLILLSYGFLKSKPLFLYEGYSTYLNIAKEHSNLNYIYVDTGTVFNHIRFMPEFMTYKESLILEPKEIEIVKGDVILEKLDEFILGINKELDEEEILEKILYYSNYTNYEVLTYGTDDINNIIYRIYK